MAPKWGESCLQEHNYDSYNDDTTLRVKKEGEELRD